MSSKRKSGFEPQDEVIKKKQQSNINFLTSRPYTDQYYTILQQRQKLPAYEAKSKLIEILDEHQCIVLQGETGSGKTTQIPQFLLEQKFNRQKGICCTQPRRVAAMSIAGRVAQEMDVKLGEEVGYMIRFEDKTSDKTILRYLTDGMLLREAMKDPMLNKYSTIIIDEAHERTLNTDILLGLIKELIKKRPKDLKVIIMSATMDAVKFQNYFYQCPLLDIPGRTFPVEVYFSNEPEQEYVQAAINTVIEIHFYEDDGDILLFLTGEEEIEDACNKIEQEIKKNKKAKKAMIIPLYSTLTPTQQQKIYNAPPPGGRKIIVSTNIAETSLTIDGVVYVVDPGFSKQKVYNPRMRVESLLVSPISKASAKQRAGRAGRTKPGKCYRLYTEESFNSELVENTYPEILRSNLSEVVLHLKRLGIENLVKFDFMDPPAPETLMRALETLYDLKALNDEGDLTDIGQKMSEFPLQPQLAKILINASYYEVSEEIATIVALLSVPNVFWRPKDQQQQADQAKQQFINFDGDHLTLLNVFNAYKRFGTQEWCYENYLNARTLKTADDIKNQLISLMRRHLEIKNQEFGTQMYYQSLRKCLLSGFFMQVAYFQKNMYYTMKDKQAVLMHPSTCLKHKPQFVLYNDLVLTKSNYMRSCLDIKPNMLFEVNAEYFNPINFSSQEIQRELQNIEREFVLNNKNNKKR